MRHILILACTVISLLLCASTEDTEDILCWTERRLTFEDFKAVYNDSIHKAYPTALGLIEKTIRVNSKLKGDTITYVITACMKRNISWIKMIGDSATLIHEQAHFDICEIYARILRREIKSTTSKVEAKALWKLTTKNEEIEHDCFDSENCHVNGGVKQEWQSYIQNRLKELDNFKDPAVKIVY